MSEKKKNSLFMQGTILAAAALITKVIGLLYRIPMANILGEQGNGIYSVAFGIYNIALTLSSYSLPLAVSKLVSARLVKRQYRNAYRVFCDALLFAVVAGAIAGSVLFLGAKGFEQFYARQGLAYPLRVLAPTIFVVAILGVFRGYFQGKNNMMPTAISQIVEQIINAIVSVLAAYQLVKVFSSSEDVAAFGAAGGTLGTFAGAAVALLFLIFLYLLCRKGIKHRCEKDQSERESDFLIYKSLIFTIIPVIIGQTIYQIGNTIDDFIFGNVMQNKGFADELISSLQGVFNSEYNQLVNLPVAIASALAVSIIPSIVASRVSEKKKEVDQKISAVIKLNMVIAFPSAVGLAVLADPIISVLFPRLVAYQEVAVTLLQVGSSAVIFYSLSTITTAVLQGSDYMRAPVRHSAISLVLHVILVYVLLQYTQLGIYSMVIGNVTFPMIVCILNCFTLGRKLSYHFKVVKTFLFPFVASGIMGGLCYLCYTAFYMISEIKLLALGIAVFVGMFSYVVIILRGKCFDKLELYDLPMGRKLGKIGGYR